MQLLLKRAKNGDVLAGSDQELLARANAGDDLTLFIESLGYNEYIIFGNYAVSAGRVSALSLPHLAHGDLPDPKALAQEPLVTSQYIYDSQANNVLVKDFLDQGQTLTTVFRGNPYYKSYAWYTTRRYKVADFDDVEDLRECGDQFKLCLTLAQDFKLVLKPDIIYFPHQGRDYLVKSSAMLLPTSLVADPQRYLAAGRPLCDNSAFSLAYLNIGSDNQLIIVHKQRFVAGEQLDAHTWEESLDLEAEGATQVTQIECGHTILVPA